MTDQSEKTSPAFSDLRDLLLPQALPVTSRPSELVMSLDGLDNDASAIMVTNWVNYQLEIVKGKLDSIGCGYCTVPVDPELGFDSWLRLVTISDLCIMDRSILLFAFLKSTTRRCVRNRRSSSAN